MNAAYHFRQLRDAASDPEKRELYEALSFMAQNIEAMDQKIDRMQHEIQSISVRIR